MSKRNGLLLLCGITLLAAGLRLWRLGDVPPGLWWDEGHRDWAALNILQGGPRPLYFAESFAEPLHVYLTVLWFRIFGVHYLASRWVSAAAGTLTVPALYWAAVEWLSGPLGRPRARSVGLLAAAALSTLFSHLLLSRYGCEVVLAPAGTVLTLAALGRGLRIRRLGWFALAGLTLGLTLYAYPAARIVPLIVVAWTIALLLMDRRALRTAWPHMALLVAVTVVTYAPLGLFYLRHPEYFFVRVNAVTAGARSGWLPVLSGFWRTALGLIVHGETYPRHNLPGRPLLDPIQTALFLVGLGLVLWRARHTSRAKALLFVPIWLLITLLPSALADGAPSFTRALGAAPPAALLAALGGEHLWRLGRHRWGRSLPTTLLVLAWLVSTTLAAIDLFIRYPTRPDVFDAYQVDQWEALTEAQEASRTGLAYLSPAPGDAFQPTVDFVLRTTPQIRPYDGRVCQVFPRQAEQDVTYSLLVLDDHASLARLQALFPTGAVVREILHQPEPYPFAEIFRIPAGAEAQIDATPIQVRFADALALIAYRAEITGGTLDLTLYWQSLVAVSVDYTVFVHLQVGDQQIGQLDSQPCAGTYPTTRWRPGEVVMEQRQLVLPAESVAGPYDLYAGLYDLPTLQRLPITAADVPFADDRAHVATVTAP
jgi:4-amino-4-deoxy-L-arabinose transferase-like glycosyltransferase